MVIWDACCTHSRGHPYRGHSDDLANDGKAELVGDASPGEDDSRGAVGELTGVASVGRAVALEGRFEAREGWCCDSVSDSVVFCDGLALDCDRNDLVLELACLLCGLSSVEGLCGKRVLPLSRDGVSVYTRVL